LQQRGLGPKGGAQPIISFWPKPLKVNLLFALYSVTPAMEKSVRQTNKCGGADQGQNSEQIIHRPRLGHVGEALWSVTPFYFLETP
jgi:hypothetical protein